MCIFTTVKREQLCNFPSIPIHIVVAWLDFRRRRRGQCQLKWGNGQSQKRFSNLFFSMKLR